MIAKLKRWAYSRGFLAVIYLLLPGLLAISGCERQEKPAATGEKDKVVITVNYGPQEGDLKAIEEWELRVKLFEQENPDIKVAVSSWIFSPASFASRAVSGTLTDLVQLWATEGEVVIKKGLAEDLTPLFENWDGYQYLNRQVLAPFIREGRIYGFPYLGYSMALFCNKEKFQQAGLVAENGEITVPQNWEEFVEFASKLTNREQGVYGFGIMGEVPRAGWHFLNWGWQAGGEFEVFEQGKWQAAFDSPAMARALQFIRDLRWKHEVVQPNALATYEELHQMFATGRVAMIIEAANSWAMTIIKEKYGFDLDNMQVALLPEGPGGRYIQMGADYYILRPGLSEEKKQACFKWCIFSVSPQWLEARLRLQNQQGRVVGVPYIPIFTGDWQQTWDKIVDKYRNIPKFEKYQREVSKYLKLEPPYYCQQLYSQCLSPAVQEVLSDKGAEPEKILRRYAQYFQTRFLDKIE